VELRGICDQRLTSSVLPQQGFSRRYDQEENFKVSHGEVNHADWLDNTLSCCCLLLAFSFLNMWSFYTYHPVQAPLYVGYDDC